MKPSTHHNRSHRAQGRQAHAQGNFARDCNASADASRKFSEKRGRGGRDDFPRKSAECGRGEPNRMRGIFEKRIVEASAPRKPVRDDFPRPIADFAVRFDEEDFSAWRGCRRWQTLRWIIAGFFAMPLLYIAFCLLLSLGDIF